MKRLIYKLEKLQEKLNLQGDIRPSIIARVEEIISDLELEDVLTPEQINKLINYFIKWNAYKTLTYDDVEKIIILYADGKWDLSWNPAKVRKYLGEKKNDFEKAKYKPYKPKVYKPIKTIKVRHELATASVTLSKIVGENNYAYEVSVRYKKPYFDEYFKTFDNLEDVKEYLFVKHAFEEDELKELDKLKI